MTRLDVCWQIDVEDYGTAYMFGVRRDKAKAHVCRTLAEVAGLSWGDALRRMRIKRKHEWDWRAPGASTRIAYTFDAAIHVFPWHAPEVAP